MLKCWYDGDELDVSVEGVIVTTRCSNAKHIAMYETLMG